MEGVEIDSSQAVEKSSQSLPGEAVSREPAPRGPWGTPAPPQTRWPESPPPGPGLSRPGVCSSSKMATGAPGPAEGPPTSEVKTPCSLPATPAWSFLPVPLLAEGHLPSLRRTCVPGAWGCLPPGPQWPWLTPLAPGRTWGLAPPGCPTCPSAEGMRNLHRSPARAVPRP